MFAFAEARLVMGPGNAQGGCPFFLRPPWALRKRGSNVNRKYLCGKDLSEAQRYVIALAERRVPFEVAAILVGHWLQAKGFQISKGNLEVAFEV